MDNVLSWIVFSFHPVRSLWLVPRGPFQRTFHTLLVLANLLSSHSTGAYLIYHHHEKNDLIHINMILRHFLLRASLRVRSQIPRSCRSTHSWLEDTFARRILGSHSWSIVHESSLSYIRRCSSLQYRLKQSDGWNRRPAKG